VILFPSNSTSQWALETEASSMGKSLVAARPKEFTPGFNAMRARLSPEFITRKGIVGELLSDGALIPERQAHCRRERTNQNGRTMTVTPKV
jgi:hypothetical protein